jgi:ABC-type multidrug transport system ATPase subunit/ABC-type multidrug transport system permease subunit
VRYAGRDLYAEYEDLSRRIGFVPQQDILHQVLTVRQAMAYGARLRFPAETTSAERRGRIQEVAQSLHLTEQFGTRVARLSGGERKRASTAMELLTKPSLLFLDEPTSGLDTDLDRDVMHLLRQLTDEGRTVVVVTHNLDYLDVCDLVLVLARGGHTAYLGPPAQAFAHFGVTSWADLFGALKTREPAAWGAAFAARPDRDPRSYPPMLDPTEQAATRLPPIRQQSVASQLWTLTRRYLAVLGADRALLAILVLLPVLLAGIARVVPGSKGLAHEARNFDARQLLLVLVVGGCLAGAAGAVRELVKERAIYKRERAVGLSRAAYLASKILVTTGIAAIQGVVLTVLSVIGRAGPGDPLVLPNGTAEIALVVATVTAVSALTGLLISALVSDENQAMPLLVLSTMAQLVFCGGLVPVAGRAVLEQLSWLLPARWGLAAAASTVDLPFLSPPTPGSGSPDDLWTHDLATWWSDLGVLVGLGAFSMLVTWWLLRRLDPLR